MSAFLGRIHYWLFNKITWHEGILEEILEYAKSKEIPVTEIKREIEEKYGAPELRALEEVIDHGNIHGWLQSRIQSVEYRIADVMIQLINRYNIKIEEIAKVYSANGERAGSLADLSATSPQELYNRVFDFMLSGMPCDRVNETVLDVEEEFAWRVSKCLHKDYWNALGGEVSDYYVLQDAWIGSFVQAANPDYVYTHTSDGLRRIKRR